MTVPLPDYSVAAINFELNKKMTLVAASDWWIIYSPNLGTKPSIAYHEQGRYKEVFDLARSLT